MNRGQFTTQMAQFAGDPTRTRYAGIYNENANRAQEQFAMDSRALWKDKSDFIITDGDATYDLPSDFMYEDYLKFNGKLLRPISRHLLNDVHGSDWTDDPGTPTHFVIDPEEAAKQVLLYPIPQGDDAGKTLFMRYYPIPVEMTTDSDVPLNSSSLMKQFHLGISAFGAWLLLMTETMPSPEMQVKKAELLVLYNDVVDKAASTFKNTASTPMRIRPNKNWGDRGVGPGRP